MDVRTLVLVSDIPKADTFTNPTPVRACSLLPTAAQEASWLLVLRCSKPVHLGVPEPLAAALRTRNNQARKLHRGLLQGRRVTVAQER